MGLCKCPKKKVTNQFCFEHRVNVCEHCMVTNHPKCIVQSYLQWLQDSDYDPLCQLCKVPLGKDTCVRLLCYHVFHWQCLDKFASQLAPNTAPAGFTCPTCGSGIFPASNLVSPVADSLRKLLVTVTWAREGLGTPLIDGKIIIEKNQTRQLPDDSSPATGTNQYNVLPPPSCQPETSSNPNTTTTYNLVTVDAIANNRADHFSVTGPFTAGQYLSSTRKVYDATLDDSFCASSVDHDEDKYKRRSALEWFARWFKSRTSTGNKKRRGPPHLYKRWIILAVLVSIGLCTIVLLSLRWGRASAEYDPMLDPHFNPNIRVQDGDGIPVVNGDFRDKPKAAPNVVE
ncbi:zinc finger protein-like 1 [Limulus polyphemus]|uniref:Zinc finger protein-like 1 homolog n=1 Tax=Limulus polyphemus TaxID=6850 RepID=A0ABM1BRN0_LIMPO|nr:zinc finger protein-like 1 [Limulus polyphemus]XP_022255604.1 zinc finger protein-like 1 [Limulus polyphemus]